MGLGPTLPCGGRAACRNMALLNWDGNELGRGCLVMTALACDLHAPDDPGAAPWALLVRTPSIGGAENAACFSYPPVIEVADRLGVIDIRG